MLTLAAILFDSFRHPRSSDSGWNIADLDSDIRADQDFYGYATGGWRRAHPVPEGRSFWAVFHTLNDHVGVRELLEQLARDEHPVGSVEQKLGDFYASGMDRRAIDETGLKPLSEALARIDSVGSTSDLVETVAWLHSRGVRPFFHFGSLTDPNGSGTVIGGVYPAKLGLPNPEQYLSEQASAKPIREAYLAYLQGAFQRLGDPPKQALSNARSVMATEIGLAKFSESTMSSRDPREHSNLRTVEEMNAITPSWDWNVYLSQMGLRDTPALNIALPEFLAALEAKWRERPLEEQKAYLRWCLVHELSDALPTPWPAAEFEFYGRRLRGLQTPPPRSEQVVRSINRSMGLALGRAYAERNITAEGRAEVESMAAHIREAMKQAIRGSELFAEQTRREALTKLSLMTIRVGYPDRWPDDDSPLAIFRDEYATNILAANQHHIRQDLAAIGKPVDPALWTVLPQMANAVYSPSRNEVVVPAGVMREPFFSLRYDAPLNYGALGFMIGHEMTHAFDDVGRRFDGEGRVRDWWSPTDESRFQSLYASLTDQFGAYQIVDGRHLSGPLVSGEALADLGGVSVAYRALEGVLRAEPEGRRDGFTPEQRFFLSFARIMAMNTRPEYEGMRVATDPHPPARYRVNGTLSNSAEFEAAFAVPSMSPMARSPRIRLW